MGATDPNTGEPTVTINLVDYFEIYNQSGFSLSGFKITGNAPLYYGTLEIGGNTGTLTLTDLVVRNLNADGSAIDIYDQSGAVILQNVDASDNPGGGVYIDSYSPIITPVTIKNSSIQNNGGTSWVNGLYINTRGAVLLDGVTVNGNGYTNSDYTAAFVDESGALTIKNSIFNDNWASGIVNENPSNGAIVLDNVFANDNRHFIDIDNEFGGVGLSLASNGTFTANNVHANGNKYQGMIADTCWSVEVPEGSGNWVCSTTAAGTVVISNSEFSDNVSNSSGLLVDAKGAITLSNVTASWNRGINRPIIDPPTPGDGSPTYTTAGAKLNNYSFTTAFPVTVNSSTFDYNSDDGLEILSKGLVTINKVTATGNGQATAPDHESFGIFINNTFGTAGVTFNGTTWDDNATVDNAHRS